MAKVTGANLRAVAREAGVSAITASRALRGSGNVAEATRSRVLEAAKRLGYRANPLVQAYAAEIRRRHPSTPSCNIAWLPSDPEHKGTEQPWMKPYLQGAVERARTLGFELDTSLDAHEISDDRLGRIFRARGIMGCLLPFMIYHDRPPFLHEGVAAVGLGECPDQRPMHTVSPDYYKNLTAAVDALLAAGYRRIGFCEHGQATVLSQGVHWGSFLWNQRRMPHKIPPLVGLVLNEGKEGFLRWFYKHQPDVVLVTFYQAGEWLREAGVRVPEDTGLAHLGLTADVAGWSGVDYEGSAIGSAGVDMLVSHILRNEYGLPNVPKLMHIPGRWVQGTTTRMPDVPMAKPVSHSYPWEWFEKNFKIGRKG